MKVRIWWDSTVEGYRIQCPYKPEFVESLKKIIPATDRAFDPATKIWLFHERWFNPIQVLVLRIFGASECAIITKEKVQEAQLPSAVLKQPLDTVLLNFMKTLPYEAAQAAYRKAAMLFHPDRGGSMERMSALNTLWNRIEKEHFNK